jgi:hypothetical protein
MPVLDVEAVPGAGDDALDEVLLRLLVGALRARLVGLALRPAFLPAIGTRRRVENHHVPDRGRSAQRVAQAVHENPLARHQRGLHRRRGDLVRLDEERLDPERQADRHRDDHD